jgi:LysM repeat protein
MNKPMQVKSFLILALLSASLSMNAQRSEDIIGYINAYKELAISEMQRTGVPASIKLAQGIHETMAGKSDLVTRSNNHFGIKCKTGWAGDKVYHDDDARQECFRSYSTPLDSYRDHSDFLKNSTRYSFLFQMDPTDYKAWAYGLKKAGYATNIKYSNILIKLIEDYNLQQYTLIAMGKLSPKEEIIAGNKVAGEEAIVLVESATSVAPEETQNAPKPSYPPGEFTINNTKVIYASSGTSVLGLAQQYDISLSRLLDFNDLKNQDVLEKDQLLYLQRKRKTGANEFHIVQKGESLYDICQAEGIRLESLIGYNHLEYHSVPAPGEKLYLKANAPVKPRLLADNSK